MAAVAAAPTQPPVSAQAVADAFVQQYYHALHHSPALIFRFYQDISKLGRPEDDGTMSISTTMQAINDKIFSLNFGNLRTEIKSVDAQEHLNGGVHVHVTGYLTGKDNLIRSFCHTFFLAPQDRGYSVLSDTFRYFEIVNQHDTVQVPGARAITGPETFTNQHQIESRQLILIDPTDHQSLNSMEELPVLGKTKQVIEADCSSTLISFEQKDSDDCVYQWFKFLHNLLGFDFNVYFLGNAIYNLRCNFPRVVVCDLHSSRWRTEEYPKLRAALSVSRQLYVLLPSAVSCCPHFEMLNVRNVSPSFVWKYGLMCQHAEAFKYPVGLHSTPIIHDLEHDNRLETDKAIINTSFEVLPDDYNNWSSTVIFFKRNDENCINVYAFNSDDCIIYYVVSCQVPCSNTCHVGCAAGDLKLYFVSTGVKLNFELDRLSALQVEVYDVPNRRWITEEFPKLHAIKPMPFVFFLDGRLYVLACSQLCRPEEPRFEMLDVNNLSQGWVVLPEPSFARRRSLDVFDINETKIIDYSEKTLYVRLIEAFRRPRKGETDLYGYNVRDNGWHEPVKYSANLTARTRNLLMDRMWSRSSVIVENYLYRFSLSEYPDGLRAVLIIKDLNDDDDTQGKWKVDISSVVAPVTFDLGDFGCLVYLGKRNSRQRFSLLVMYACDSCCGYSMYHLCTCTFDLRRSTDSTESFIVEAICCQYRHTGLMCIYDCFKLCGVEDDC